MWGKMGVQCIIYPLVREVCYQGKRRPETRLRRAERTACTVKQSKNRNNKNKKKMEKGNEVGKKISKY